MKGWTDDDIHARLFENSIDACDINEWMDGRVGNCKNKCDIRRIYLLEKIDRANPRASVCMQYG